MKKTDCKKSDAVSNIGISMFFVATFDVFDLQVSIL